MMTTSVGGSASLLNFFFEFTKLTHDPGLGRIFFLKFGEGLVRAFAKLYQLTVDLTHPALVARLRDLAAKMVAAFALENEVPHVLRQRVVGASRCGCKQEKYGKQQAML